MMYNHQKEEKICRAYFFYMLSFEMIYISVYNKGKWSGEESSV